MEFPLRELRYYSMLSRVDVIERFVATVRLNTLDRENTLLQKRKAECYIMNLTAVNSEDEKYYLSERQ